MSSLILRGGTHSQRFELAITASPATARTPGSPARTAGDRGNPRCDWRGSERPPGRLRACARPRRGSPQGHPASAEIRSAPIPVSNRWTCISDESPMYFPHSAVIIESEPAVRHALKVSGPWRVSANDADLQTTNIGARYRKSRTPVLGHSNRRFRWFAPIFVVCSRLGRRAHFMSAVPEGWSHQQTCRRIYGQA
jgi:hypothetical protein